MCSNFVRTQTPSSPNHCVDDMIAARLPGSPRPVPGTELPAVRSAEEKRRKGGVHGAERNPLPGWKCLASEATGADPARVHRLWGGKAAALRPCQPACAYLRRVAWLDAILAVLFEKSKDTPLYIFLLFQPKDSKICAWFCSFFLGSATCLARDPGALRCPPGAGYRLRDWG